MHNTQQVLEVYLESQIKEHRTTYLEGEIRDFIDLYLKYETEHKEFYTSAFNELQYAICIYRFSHLSLINQFKVLLP